MLFLVLSGLFFNKFDFSRSQEIPFRLTVPFVETQAG